MNKICLILGMLIVFSMGYIAYIATAKINDEPPHMRTPLVTGVPKPSKPLSDDAIATIYISQHNIKSRNEQTLNLVFSKGKIDTNEYRFFEKFLIISTMFYVYFIDAPEIYTNMSKMSFYVSL